MLTVENLSTAFRLDNGSEFRAVDRVSFSVPEKHVLAVVGESGCGKSVTALSILRLLPPRITTHTGRVMFNGQDLLTLDDRAMRSIRGRRISMIFQDPMTSLNPVYAVGSQVVEGIRAHEKVSASAAKARAIELFVRVGIPAAAERYNAYPHQLSGGMRQRVMIAMALSCRPSLIIADEPTTALDVTIQAQILDLLASLRDEFETSILLITHDLGVVAQFADEVIVMYAGRIAERATAAELFASPQHPYTNGLLASVPRLDLASLRPRLATIRGVVPNLATLPPGCRFQDRCDRVLETCRTVDPELSGSSGATQGRHAWACHNPVGEAAARKEAV